MKFITEIKEELITEKIQKKLSEYKLKFMNRTNKFGIEYRAILSDVKTNTEIKELEESIKNLFNK